MKKKRIILNAVRERERVIAAGIFAHYAKDGVVNLLKYNNGHRAMCVIEYEE